MRRLAGDLEASGVLQRWTHQMDALRVAIQTSGDVSDSDAAQLEDAVQEISEGSAASSESRMGLSPLQRAKAATDELILMLLAAAQFGSDFSPSPLRTHVLEALGILLALRAVLESLKDDG